MRLSVKLASLTKMFMKAKSALDIHVAANDPCLYFPTLLDGITESLDLYDEAREQKRAFTPALKAFLSSVTVLRVSHLATSLSALPREVALHQNRAYPAVAAAIIVLAFEGEAAKAMPDHSDLIAMLAGRVGFGKKTIEERYRELSKLVEDWRGHLPWLTPSCSSGVEAKGKRKRSQGVAMREANARYLKDVVTFQTQLKLKALEDIDQIEDTSSSDDNDEAFDALDDLRSSRPSSTTEDLGDSGHSSVANLHNGSRASKRRRVSSAPPSPSSLESAITRQEGYHSNAGRPDAYVRRMKRPGTTKKQQMRDTLSNLFAFGEGEDHPSLLTIPQWSTNAEDDNTRLGRAMLHAPSVADELAPPLSRLGTLALSRGGEGYIEDEELFEPGEFEALIRDESERLRLEVTLNEDRWDSS